MKKFLIIFSVAIFLSGILHFSGYGIPGSALICRFVHMILGKQELFQPEILEEFHFWEKGYTKTIQFNPKYAELYSIGFLPQPQDIPATYQYKGTLKLEIYSNNRLLYEATITEPKTVTYKERDTNFIKEIAFADFEVPLKGRRRDLILKLTVVEPDSTLERWKRSIRLFVGVSGTPQLLAIVGHNPLSYIDPLGLWGSDVHIGLDNSNYGTYIWAKEVNFSDSEAAIIAYANNAVDGGPSTDFLPWYWGGYSNQKGYYYSLDEIKSFQKEWDIGYAWLSDDRKYLYLNLYWVKAPDGVTPADVNGRYQVQQI